MQQSHLLFHDIDEPGLNTRAVYERRGGYQALRKALGMSREQVVAELEASGIRGRGGAGFPMGKKVSFIPQGGMDKYLVCNADESEPGTFKDRELMQKNPHALIEGIVIASYAMGATKSFIYIRGEYVLQADILDLAIAYAREAGYLGDRLLGSQHSVTLWVHRGAGAYICGEETAPPWPAAWRSAPVAAQKESSSSSPPRIQQEMFVQTRTRWRPAGARWKRS